ncbi:hypothetical protein SAMN05660733_08251 [Lentzea albidocapillata]|uniref:Uncharacterized protein n=2 Tax=Lentzea albidocapillata TaxID=40571 RepID=A0A1W2FUU3_9PSEU|nr:hypothetical protein SAMN05660733_08251 [Lentzea albidocapillata]
MRNTGSGKSLVRAAGMLFVLVISLEASAMLLASDPALHGQINDLFELPINAISYALLLWPVLVMVSRR